MTGEGSLFDVPPAAIGRFRVLHQIGAGTCGPVFRAVAPDGETPVAIKLITTPLPPERTRRAVEALAGLVDLGPRMEGAVGLVEAGLHASQPYLVTAIAPGDSLDVAIKQFGPALLPDLVPRLEVLAAALDAAGAAGIAHGALHPRDVLVAEAGTVLTGLGVWPALVREGARLPIRRPYRAPEVADGILDAAGDRFALAALAFEWMTGRRVTPGAGFIDVPPSLGMDQARVTEVFTRALHDDPAERFPSALAFVDALGSLADDRGDEERRPSSRVKRRSRIVAPQLPLGADTDDDMRDGDGERPVGAAGGEGFADDLPLAVWPVAEAGEQRVDEPQTGIWSADEPQAGAWSPDEAVAGEPRPARGVAFVPPPAGRRAVGAMLATLLLGLALGLGAGFALWGRGTPPERVASGATSHVGVDPATQSDGESAAAAAPAPAAAAAATSPLAPAPASPPAAPAPEAVPAESDDGAAAARLPRASTEPARRQPPRRAPAPAAARAGTPSAAPARPPAVARTGTLLVDSRPVGATVRLDGRAVGVTPVTLSDLAPGQYTVSLQLSGFRPLTTTVRVVAGERARAAASLTRAQEPR